LSAVSSDTGFNLSALDKGTNEEMQKGLKTWEDIKKENNIIDQPTISTRRKEHYTMDDVIGKDCCKCKNWNPLTNYNNDKNHWDKLRVTCKSCLSEERIQNKNRITEYNKEYWERTKEEQTLKHKIWAENNKDYIKEKNKGYRIIHGKEIDKKQYQ
jgi:hypothetical protein